MGVCRTRELLGSVLLLVLLAREAPASGSVLLSLPPKFFASSERSEVVFLCDRLPAGVVARLRSDREVELIILGASLPSRSSGGFFGNPLKASPAAPAIRSVRVFPTASGDVAASVKLATVASRVDALSLGEPPRVILRLFAPRTGPEAELATAADNREPREGGRLALKEPSKRVTSTKVKLLPRAKGTHDAGPVRLIADSGSSRPRPGKSSKASKKASSQQAESARKSIDAVKTRAGKDGAQAGQKVSVKPKATAAATAVEKESPPKVDRPDAIALKSPPVVVSSTSTASAGEPTKEVQAAPSRSDEPDSFPYRLSRLSGVAFLWPDLDSSSYQADEQAREIAGLLRRAGSGEGRQSSEADEIEQPSTPAALYLAADLSLIRAARSKHLLGSIADYRRALRNQPEWPDARRALANILNAYVAIGFDTEALGIARELARAGEHDELASLARALSARLAIDRKDYRTARRILKRMGTDKDSTERCFKTVIKGELAANEKKQDEAKQLIKQIESWCPPAISDDPATMLLKGRLYLSGGNAAKALEILPPLLGQLASRHEATKLAWALVEAKEKTGDTPGAKEELKKIVSGSFGQAAAERARISLAVYSAREGTIDEALKVLAAVYVRAGGVLAELAAERAAAILGMPGKTATATRELIRLAQRGGDVAETPQAIAVVAKKSTYELDSAFEAKDYRQVITAYARRSANADKDALGAERQWMVGRSFLELGFEDEAARLLRDSLAGATGRLRATVLKDLLRAVLKGKRYGEAERLAAELLRQPLDAKARSWAKLAKARAAIGLGRRATALKLLRDALKTASPQLAPEIRLELAELLRKSDEQAARVSASEAASMAFAVPGNQGLLARARLLEAEAAVSSGDLVGAVAALAEAAKGTGDPELAAFISYRQAHLLEEIGETDAAREVYGQLAGAPNRLLDRLSTSSRTYWSLLDRLGKLEGSPNTGF